MDQRELTNNMRLLICALAILTSWSCSRKCVIISSHFKVDLNKNNFIGNCQKIYQEDSIVNLIRLREGRQYKIMYSPSLVNKKREGVYQYWLLRIPMSTDNFFLVKDKQLIYFNQVNSSFEKELSQLGFSKKDISILIKRINGCIKYNQSVSNNF